ncbi:hypothetical protein SK128_026969, partial [Halocaridina rubra]
PKISSLLGVSSVRVNDLSFSCEKQRGKQRAYLGDLGEPTQCLLDRHPSPRVQGGWKSLRGHSQNTNEPPWLGGSQFIMRSKVSFQYQRLRVREGNQSSRGCCRDGTIFSDLLGPVNSAGIRSTQLCWRHT